MGHSPHCGEGSPHFNDPANDRMPSIQGTRQVKSDSPRMGRQDYRSAFLIEGAGRGI